MLGTCLHMMQGTPYIYQGEEIGMTNCQFESIREYEDVESVAAFKQRTEMMGEDPDYMMRCIRKKSRDNARTAMQWDNGPYGGFGDNGVWFSVNPNYKKINVKSQLKDNKSILNYYKELIRLRKRYPIIVYGDYKPLFSENEENFCYVRRYHEEELLVLCSFSEKEQKINLPVKYQERRGKILITNMTGIDDCKMGLCQLSENTVLEPYEAKVILFESL